MKGLFIFFLFCFFTSIFNAQQTYPGNSAIDCNDQAKTDPSLSFLYTCNGQNPSCQAFLIFKSQFPYNSVVAISNFMSSDLPELARINNVSGLMTFPPNKELIVPVNCSCSSKYYQANTSYLSEDGDTYFKIADKYQGLSTCNALMAENEFDASSLRQGSELTVPLRCACPTSDQISKGTKHLLIYSINIYDTVYSLSKRFNVSKRSIYDANGLSEQDTIYPSTLILIPLLNEPSSLQTITHPSPPVSQPPPVYNTEKKRSKKRICVGIGIGISFTVLVLCAVRFIAFLCHKKMDREGDHEDNIKGKKQWVLPEDLLAGMADVGRVLRVFTFEELQEGTNDFSPKCMIQGSVYRGVVDGDVFAIKKMSRDVSKEINILNKFNHSNLIRLDGLCAGQEICYLIYEYMENGSLQDWLWSKNRSMVRSWNQTVQIALDVANGLHYIHNFTEPACVHKDIKSSNILLTRDLRAKIANFGLARSAESKEGEFELTRHVVGTKGYMAPEYIENGLITPKLDVYAFGVMMLELITGKDAIIKPDEGQELLLSTEMVSIMKGENVEDKLANIMDSDLQESYRMDLAISVAKLGVDCLSQDPASRPNMDEVVSTLSRIQMIC